MDFVLKKLNSYIAVSEKRTVDRQTLLRERIEYMLFQTLGCLWNSCLNRMGIEDIKTIVNKLHKMSIGETVSAIRLLDQNFEYVSKREMNILDKYPALRNQALGHGYTHIDLEENIELALEELYDEMVKLNFFKKEYDIVIINEKEENKYEGIRFAVEGGGIPLKWSCPASIMGDDCSGTYLFDREGESQYIKVSPFINVMDKGDAVYVFQSLEDKLSGNVKLNRLFSTGTKNIIIRDFIDVGIDSDRRRISSNGTIMNYFEKNYNNYIGIPLEKEVKTFLRNNRSNVQVTLWGHGGVGKTACIQSVCMELYNNLRSEFSYIIFVSAKDRKYDVEIGKIVSMGGVRTYKEVLDNIVAVLFDEDNKDDEMSTEKRIKETTNKVLLVIDDYETFADEEKSKIQTFISGLNIDYFKVVITTRNKRFSTGVEIKLDELDIEESKKFLGEIFKKEYPEYERQFAEDICLDGAMEAIYAATSGRPLFLYQFTNQYVQKGLGKELIQELKGSGDAKEFLYGRIYDYLGGVAKKEFSVISQIINEEDLIFKEEILLYLMNEIEKDVAQEGIQELVEQKIIEEYDDDHYRVYSQDMYERMKMVYEKSDDAFKDKIHNRLSAIGGKNIKGTIYEAMLDEANASRNNGNVKDTLQKYKHILNEKECDKYLKKKALLNLTSYISINLMDNEQTIAVFEEYIDKLHFAEDVEIIKMYVQYLWRSDEIAKAKACDILDRFFGKKKNKKFGKHNFELFTIAVSYCSHNVLDNTPEKVKSNAENRVLNEYGIELFEGIKKKEYGEYKASIRHNVALALIATVKLAIDLETRGYNKEVLINEIKAYGEDNFNEIFRKQLQRLVATKEEEGKYGDLVNAKITYIAKYGLLVEIEGMGRAIIHNTEIRYGQRDGLKAGDKIQAMIIGHNEKGYILSIKEL